MTEDRLRSALEEYAEPLRYQPPVSQRRRFPVRLALVGASGMLASFLAFGLLTPQTSAASVMQRMQAALTDAKTMRAEMTILDPVTGKEQPDYVRRWYDHGVWRIHGRIGRFRERIVLLKDDRMYSYLPTKHVVTVEPTPKVDAWDFKGGSALDFAMNEVNSGQINISRQSRLEPGPNGVDRLILERKEDSYRCVIDVDRKTGLPIRARATVDFGRGEGSQTTIHRFFFNEIVSPSLFDPAAFKAPIMDLLATQAHYRRKWSPPLGEASGLQIRDGAVASDGTIFITTSGSSGTPMPDTVQNSFGTEYLRMEDMYPGGVRADTNASKSAPYGRGWLRTTIWIPLEPLAKRVSEIRVGLSRRSIDANAIGVGNPHLVEEVTIPLRRLQGSFPEFGTAFVLDSYEDSLAVNAADRRADYYRRKGNLESELRWLKNGVREQTKRVPRWGREAAERLAAKLRGLGREAEAQEVEAEFELKAQVPPKP